MLKKCSICKTEKPLNEFNKRAISKDGVRSECRLCTCAKNLEIRRSKTGWVAETLHTQKRNSKKRNMDQPAYTLNELTHWVMSQEVFHKLYNEWCNSGYLTSLRPSIDRLDDYEPYTVSNIQLVTWEENVKKLNKDVKEGVNRKPLKSVIQLSLDYKEIKTFYSIAEAARHLNLRSSGIVNCLKGRYKTSGGFRWKYS